VPKLTLTARGVAALETDRPQQDFWDELTPGLVLRVTEHGRKTYVVRYRANGTHRRMTLGRHPNLTLAAAREKAREALAAAQAGEDPALERQRLRSSEATFEALAREVLAAKAERTRRRTREERERMLEKELLPAWGNRPADSIGRRDVLELLEAIVRRGSPVAANRTLRLVQLIFNEGLRRGFPTVEANPAHMMQPPGRETRRRRYLSRDEIRTVWRALEPENLHTGAVFRLALLTAQRIGSVAAMRWEDVDAADVWTIPEERFKGRRPHLVPLSAEALAVLEGLPRWQEYAFPSRADAEAPYMTSTGPALQRIRARTDKLDVPHWTAHDFRRTFRTHATRPENPEHPKDPAGLGVRPAVADAVLGHKEATLGFDRYTGDRERYLLSEKREALRRWGAFIREAVEADQ
jgi:integrase